MEYRTRHVAMLWKSKRAPSVKRGDLTAVIDSGSEIEGKYTCTGTVMLNAKLHGEVMAKDTLLVGDKGEVNGNIRAGSVVISGQVIGNVVATERVELRRNARVFGDLDSPVIVIEEGALFEGLCRMTKPKPTEAARDLSLVSLKR